MGLWHPEVLGQGTNRSVPELRKAGRSSSVHGRMARPGGCPMVARARARAAESTGWPRCQPDESRQA